MLPQSIIHSNRTIVELKPKSQLRKALLHEF